MKFKYFVRNFFYSERNSMKKRSLTIFNYRSILMPHESGLTQHENILNLREQEEYHMKLDDFPSVCLLKLLIINPNLIFQYLH